MYKNPDITTEEDQSGDTNNAVQLIKNTRSLYKKTWSPKHNWRSVGYSLDSPFLRVSSRHPFSPEDQRNQILSNLEVNK